jgi:hypothetical protein
LDVGCRRAGRARHASADARGVHQNLLHHERAAEFDETEHHHEEDRRDDRELSHRGTASARCIAELNQSLPLVCAACSALKLIAWDGASHF